MPTLPVRSAIMPSDLRPLIEQGLNGKLPVGILSTIPLGGQLHHLAARAWLSLRTDVLVSTGYHLDYTARTGGGAYRTYDRQVQLLKERAIRGSRPAGSTWQRYWAADPQGPATWYGKADTAPVATPGGSNHGIGLAIDMALDPDSTPGGPVTDMPADLLNWLIANAHRHGWSWESQVEPWHVRYISGDSLPAAVLAYEDSLNPTPIGDDLMLIKGDGPNLGSTAFPHTGNGLAVYAPVFTPDGPLLVWVGMDQDEGDFAEAMRLAGAVSTIPQAKVDACEKWTPQQHRDFLRACATPGTSTGGGGIDPAELAAIVKAAVDAVIDGATIASIPGSIQANTSV